MEIPIVCPYCWDRAIEPLPTAELFARSGSGERHVAGEVFRCRRWHVFAMFPQEFLQTQSTNSDQAAKMLSLIGGQEDRKNATTSPGFSATSHSEDAVAFLDRVPHEGEP